VGIGNYKGLTNGTIVVGSTDAGTLILIVDVDEIGKEVDKQRGQTC
jgi:hypothetical protein